MKSPVRVFLNAVGASPWIPVDYRQAPFAIGLVGIPSSGSTLTWLVEHTFDELGLQSAGRPVTCARAATVMTVTDLGPFFSDDVHNPQFGAHGLTAGDSVLLGGTGSSQMNSPITANGAGGDVGWTIATVPSATTYTITVANAGPTADSGGAQALGLRVVPHSTLGAGQATRTDGNYAFPPKAVRFRLSAYTSGSFEGLIIQGSR